MKLCAWHGMDPGEMQAWIVVGPSYLTCHVLGSCRLWKPGTVVGSSYLAWHGSWMEDSGCRNCIRQPMMEKKLLEVAGALEGKHQAKKGVESLMESPGGMALKARTRR